MSRQTPTLNFETYSFAKIFGSQVVSARDSKNFVQRLVAVSVATIAYSRFLFPANWFRLLDIDGVKAALFNRNTCGPAGDYFRSLPCLCT